MKSISIITTTNFKGDKQKELFLHAPTLILTGQNGSGKTTLIQAMKLAVNGSLPEIKANDIFKLARREDEVNDMSVALEFFDGFEFRRTWTRNSRLEANGDRKETISQAIELLPEKGERTIAEKDSRIKTECGLNPIMIDVGEFLRLSDNKRRDFFYDLGGAQTIDWPAIDAALTCAFSVNGPLENTWLAGLEEMKARWDRQPDLEALLSWLSDELSSATREVRQAKAATEQMVKIRSEKKQVAGLIENLQTEKQSLFDRRGQLTGDIAASEARTQATLSREHDIQTLKNQIAELEKEDEEKHDSKKQKQEIADLETEYGKITANYQARIETQNTAADEAELGANDLREKCEKLQNKQAAAADRQSLFNKILKQKDLLCKACTTRVAEAFNTAETNKEAVGDQIEQIRKELNAANETQQKIRAALLTLEKEHERVKADYNYRIRAAVERRDYTLNEKPKLATKILRLREDLKFIQTARFEEPQPVDELRAQLEGVDSRAKEVEETLGLKREEWTRMETQLEILAKADSAENRQLCLKQFIRQLGPAGLKGDLVKATLDPIRLEVNDCLKIFGCPHNFTFKTRDGRGNEVFQFGWTAAGLFIDFDSLSTGQQVILLACLVAVICKYSDTPFRFMALDNVEVISSDYERAFFSGLPILARACRLDNLFVATSKGLPKDCFNEKSPDVEVIHCASSKANA